MATSFVILHGKGKWIKVTRPNRFGKWSLDLYMNQENLETFKTMGVKNHVKKDEEGYYVTFSRPTEIHVRGKAVALQPPQILDKDNIPILLGGIGNGSDITVKVEHYSYTNPMSKIKEHACRLFAVRIDNLVPWDEGSLNDPDEMKAVKDFKAKPIAF